MKCAFCDRVVLCCISVCVCLPCSLRLCCALFVSCSKLGGVEWSGMDIVTNEQSAKRNNHNNTTRTQRNKGGNTHTIAHAHVCMTRVVPYLVPRVCVSRVCVCSFPFPSCCLCCLSPCVVPLFPPSSGDAARTDTTQHFNGYHTRPTKHTNRDGTRKRIQRYTNTHTRHKHCKHKTNFEYEYPRLIEPPSIVCAVVLIDVGSQY